MVDRQSAEKVGTDDHGEDKEQNLNSQEQLAEGTQVEPSSREQGEPSTVRPRS